jgi:hypothetical protein
LRDLVAHGLCLAFWCAAVAPGLAAVWGLEWHYDLDGYHGHGVAIFATGEQ